MTTKKEEMTEDMSLKGTKFKLQMARVLLQEENLKKTGKNKFANFNFFQLNDFIPSVNKIFVKLGLYSEFNISPMIIDYEEKNVIENGTVKTTVKTPIIKEMANLTIYNINNNEEDDIITYEMEVAPVMIGNNSKQNIYQAAGGRQTYYKRYLYMNALEIVEDDESDTVLGQEDINYSQPQTMRNIQEPNVISQSLNSVHSQDVNIVKDATILENSVENIKNEFDNNLENELLSQESKIEIMNLVNTKGINGAELIGKFCKEHGLENTNDLLEIHKTELIKMVNTYNE